MKFCFLVILAFRTNIVYAFETKIIFKNNLSFTAASLESIDRENETFSSENTDPRLKSLIRSIVQSTVNLLPAQYLPPLLTISVERSVLFTKPGKIAEQVPLSVVLTFQIPTKNEIRYTDFETKDHPEATRTIVAHEMGHMLIEWACRAVGVTKPTDRTIQSSHWVGSIYEGVADYIAASVTNRTVIGTPGAWHARDILKFDTLAAAHRGSLRTIELVEQGFIYEGLIPRFQTYIDMLAEFKRVAPDNVVGAPYVEAPWLAGQLWQLNRVYNSNSVFDSILKIAISGKKYVNPELFLSDVKLSLEKLESRGDL